MDCVEFRPLRETENKDSCFCFSESKSGAGKRVLEGGDESNFYLQPSDIVYIRERFNWF